MSASHASYPEGADEVDIAYIDSLHIPDGSFVQGIVSVVSYVLPDGSNGWMMHHNCDMPASNAIGLLACGQVELMARTAGMITNVSPQLPDDDE